MSVRRRRRLRGAAKTGWANSYLCKAALISNTVMPRPWRFMTTDAT